MPSSSSASALTSTERPGNCPDARSRHLYLWRVIVVLVAAGRQRCRRGGDGKKGCGGGGCGKRSGRSAGESGGRGAGKSSGRSDRESGGSGDRESGGRRAGESRRGRSRARKSGGRVGSRLSWDGSVVVVVAARAGGGGHRGRRAGGQSRGRSRLAASGHDPSHDGGPAADRSEHEPGRQTRAGHSESRRQGGCPGTGRSRDDRGIGQEGRQALAAVALAAYHEWRCARPSWIPPRTDPSRSGSSRRV